MEFLHKLLKKLLSFMAHTALTLIGLLAILASLGGFIAGELLGGGIVFFIGLAMTAFGTRSLWYPNYRQKPDEKNRLQDIRYTPLGDGSHDRPVSDFADECYGKVKAIAETPEAEHLNFIFEKSQNSQIKQKVPEEIMEQ